MLFKSFLKNTNVPQKYTFWIASAGLIVVLLNNHLYLGMLQKREKEMHEMEIKASAKEEGQNKRDRLLRLWEMELMQREKDVKSLIDAAKIERKKLPSAG